MSPTSWLEVPEDSDFSLSNLPLGVFSTLQNSNKRHCATRLGNTLIDLGVLESALLFADIPGLRANVFYHQDTLNAFVEHSRPVWKAVRERLTSLLTSEAGGDDRLFKNEALQKAAFYNIDSLTSSSSSSSSSSTIQMHLPIKVCEYTDFYSSREHATNVGTMFRGKDHALQPNWLHLPVGYHGRASSVVVSGTPIRRPCGQLQKDPKDESQGSIHAACRRLDFELEMATVIGGPSNKLSEPLTMAQAKDRIFGFALMNDWSARDIQKWEYVPLGPFTAKNFGTTISPWIVMAEALEQACEKVPTSAGSSMQQSNPTPLPYLHDPDYSSYNVELTVAIQTKNQNKPMIISESNLQNLYWTAAQQLVHHSVSGCVMHAGDLLGSGTISGSTPHSYGSLLELSWNGTQPVTLSDKEKRTFLEDGDTVILTGVCAAKNMRAGHGRIGFGECTGTILPALSVSPTESSSSSSTVEKPAASPYQDQGRYRNFKLYGYWRSSSTWRVRVQLAAMSIDFETIPINIVQGEQKTESFLAKNPLGQVPLLEFTDTVTGKTVYLAQSLAIVEFLDHAFPERYSLMPKDPFEKALALEMVELINAGTQPLQNAIYLQQMEQKSEGKILAAEQAKVVNENGLGALEVLVQRKRGSEEHRHHGPYCLGSFAPTIVDAFLVPQLYNARRFDADVKSLCPTLVEIEQLCLEHPWFQASHPKVQIDASE
jgi:fumarylacetoacetase